MLLAGKSAERERTWISAESGRAANRSQQRNTVTFSFDEEDGGVSVGGSLHLSNQRFLLFIFFFFRLHTHTHMVKDESVGDEASES